MKKIQSLTVATTVGFILLIDAPFSGGSRAHASDEPEKLSPSELITKLSKLRSLFLRRKQIININVLLLNA